MATGINGWVTIGFKADTKQLEKDKQKAERELKAYDKEVEKLTEKKLELEIDQKKYDETVRQIEELKSLIEESKGTLKTYQDKHGFDDPKAFNLRTAITDAEREQDALVKKVQQESSEREKNARKLDSINRKLQEAHKNQDTAKEKVEDIKEDLEDAKKASKYAFSPDASKITSSFTGLGNTIRANVGGAIKKAFNFGTLNKGFDGLLKKVAKWGLAILGIRSVYNMVRQAVSTITQDNEELANKLAVIKGAIASAIEPIVTRIVNLVYTLLSFVNSIVTKLTGRDLFAQAKKNLASGAKSAKEIKNQLAGFDEMNVLSDSSGGGGGSTAGLDNVDSGLLDVLEKYKEMFLNGDFAGLAQSLSNALTNALNGFADKIKSIDWSGIGENISQFLTNIDFSGILVGLVRVFGEAAIGMQNLLLAIDWPTVLANFSKGIADAIAKIGEYLDKVRWSEIGKKISDTIISIKWADIGISIMNTIWSGIGGLGEALFNIDWLELGKTWANNIHKLIENFILLFEEVDWMVLGADIADAIIDFVTGVDWEQLGIDILVGLLQGLKSAVFLILGFFSTLVSAIFEDIFGSHSPSKVFAELGTNIMQGLFNGIKSLVDTVLGIFRTLLSNIKSIFSTVGSFFRDIFKGAVDKIRDTFGAVVNVIKSIWEKVASVIRSPINTILGAIESMINTIINGLNKLIRMINKISFDVPDWIPVIGGKKWGFKIPEAGKVSLPRLAKGAIASYPGAGIPTSNGGARWAENGREAYLPLTDSQVMQELGESIGRFVTINAYITNTMNGRVISRELQKINNENDFAFNR